MGHFSVSGAVQAYYGPQPHGGCEALYISEDSDRVLVGVGFRVYNDDVTTMHLAYARLQDDGTIDQNDIMMVKRGIVPESGLECWFQCGTPNEVIVGIGLRAYDDDMVTMRVHTRKIDQKTGMLMAPYTHLCGKAPTGAVEADGMPEEDPEHTLLRGIGARVRDDDVKTLELTYGTLIMT